MYIGIDLGGTNIAAGIVNAGGRLEYKKSIPTRASRAAEEIVKDIISLCKSVTSEAGYGADDIEGIGIGCPGTINNETGVVVYCNNLPLSGVNLKEELQSALGKPANVENDANAATLGEYAVNGGGADSFIFITLGTGVGGGIIINGKLYRGFNCAGGELGHIIVEQSGGIQCTCGNRGCWEAYASVTALIRQTEEKLRENPASAMHEWARKNGRVSGRTAFECAKRGDKAACEVVDAYIKHVGAGLISILNIFQPEKILIGGGISREGEYLLKPLRDYVYAGDYNKYMPKTTIEAASLFNDAGIIGAALGAVKI